MTKIPKPGELGLKIPSWRAGQEEAIHLMLTSTKRVTGICAPCGFGKSDAVVAAAILSGKPTCVVTSSRGLQNQYMDQHACVGMVDIRGRRNYTCDMKPDCTCEEGYAARCPYKGTIACPSSQAEMRAATSRLVVTNYDKWTSARRFGQGMAHFEQVIFDEGDEGPEALSRAMQVFLNHKEIEQNLKIDFPPEYEADEFPVWKPWAAAARVVAEVAMLAAQARIAGLADPKVSWVRHYTHMRNLVRRLSTIATASAKDWIVEKTDEGYQFDPIRPGKYAEAALLLRVPRIIFISATIRPKTLFMCGIGKDHFDFKEFDSDFDPKRCPIYYVPTMRVDSRNPDLSMMWARLDQFMSRRRDRKGLIQTTSFQYQKDVRSASRFSDTMFLNAKGEPPTELVEKYKAAGPGSTLVSPSIGRGYDFPDDDARFNFVLKIPFDPPSKILKAREQDDKEYRSYRAMQKLVQAFGRDARSKRDWSERFIGDEHCEWFLPRYGHLAPRSFHGFFKRLNILPQPPKIGEM